MVVGSVLAACSFESGRPVAMGDAPQDDGSDHGDAAIDAKADARVCPSVAGCTAFQCATSSSCYYYCTAKLPWEMAQAACAKLPSGCLVTINDQAEQDCIVQNVMPMFVNFPWIGFRQSPSGAEPAGGWSFQCGASSYPPHWGPNEPNEVGSEDCAAMSEGGSWFDGTCTDNGRYVCEVP